MSGTSKAMDALYWEAADRLMAGMKPDAGAILKRTYPKMLDKVIADLDKNYTPQGIKAFEVSLRNGFKKIEKWHGG